jgi:two-component system OmpR family response regulator
MVRPQNEDVRLVLVVEDDGLQAAAVQEFLEAHGLDVSHARGVEEARALLTRHPFDVVVLDRMLNRRDALGFIAEIQTRFGVPVLVASAHGDEVDRVLGLERGADDYLTKPYSLPELLARIRAVHRRTRGQRSGLPAGRRAAFAEWMLDESAHRLTHRDGRTADLSAGELAVLVSLLEHPGRVLARHELLALTHKTDGDVFDRSVDVLISRLRRKLDSDALRPEIIQTIRGGGYRVAVQVVWS